MLDDLDAVPWASLAQPEWNAPDAVPRALRRLAGAGSERESEAAYTAYLFAVGNDHAGTYYPVVLATLPFLGAVLERGGEWAKRTALAALIDLTASFEPEPGHESAEAPGGGPSGLAAQLAAGAARLSDAVHAVAADTALAERTRAAATELLTHLAPAGPG
ncbi:MAG: hypothetical protein ACJ79S_18735 [Gemmatimonadaceae bacterium]